MESHNICPSVTGLLHDVLQVVAQIEFPSFFKAKKYFIGCIQHMFFIHSSVSGNLCCFRILTIMNNAVMSMGVQISLPDPNFNSFYAYQEVDLLDPKGSSIF